MIRTSDAIIRMLEGPTLLSDAAFVMKPWCLGSSRISFFLKSFKYPPLLDARRMEAWWGTGADERMNGTISIEMDAEV